jgi:hypothetical protein
LWDLNHDWFGDFLERRNKKGGSKERVGWRTR